MAAVQAKKMGMSVVIVSPDKHLGGLSAGGLGFTDTGRTSIIGGLYHEFYHRIYQHDTENPHASKLETPEAFEKKS